MEFRPVVPVSLSAALSHRTNTFYVTKGLNSPIFARHKSLYNQLRDLWNPWEMLFLGRVASAIPSFQEVSRSAYAI